MRGPLRTVDDWYEGKTRPKKPQPKAVQIAAFYLTIALVLAVWIFYM